MPYYMYQGGFCGHCGRDLGMIDTNGGPYRRYCNAACKQAAYRERHTKRDKKMLRNARDYWGNYGFSDIVLKALDGMLQDFGYDATQAAVEIACQSCRDAREERQARGVW